MTTATQVTARCSYRPTCTSSEPYSGDALLGTWPLPCIATAPVDCGGTFSVRVGWSYQHEGHRQPRSEVPGWTANPLKPMRHRLYSEATPELEATIERLEAS